MLFLEKLYYAILAEKRLEHIAVNRLFVLQSFVFILFFVHRNIILFVEYISLFCDVFCYLVVIAVPKIYVLLP